MITPEEIKKRLARRWPDYLASLCDREKAGIFPVEVKAPRLAIGNLAQFARQVDELRAGSASPGKPGYQIEWVAINTRLFGSQSVPGRAFVANESDYLQVLSKQKEATVFKKHLEDCFRRVPELLGWVRANPLKVLQHSERWEDLLTVCRYFLDEDFRGLYVRQLPVGVHTKFIEQNKGTITALLTEILPAGQVNVNAPTFEGRFGLREANDGLVRFRLLDPYLLERLHVQAEEMALPPVDFAALPFDSVRVVITENLTNYRLLPPVENTIAIMGAGFAIAANAKLARWLSHSTVYYWGDLDAQGFMILSALRAQLPQVHSLMMDEQTLEHFAEQAKRGTPTATKTLPHLEPQEQQLFLRLAKQNLRLEQERINCLYATQKVREALLTF